MEVDLLKYDFGMCYFNSSFMNIAGKKCFWNRMYQKIVQMINLSQNILWTIVTKYCLQLSQDVCVIKTIWSTSFQIMEKDLECAVISTVAGRN